MSLFYSKLLPLLVYPLGAAIFLGLVALAMSFTRHRAVTRAVLALALVGLWVASTPTFSYALAAWMEADFTPTDPANLPRADAIILLGGLSVQRSPAGDIDLAGFSRSFCSGGSTFSGGQGAAHRRFRRQSPLVH